MEMVEIISKHKNLLYVLAITTSTQSVSKSMYEKRKDHIQTDMQNKLMIFMQRKKKFTG